MIKKNPTPEVSVATEGKIGYLNLVTRAVDDRKQDSEALGIPVMTAATERTVYVFPWKGKSWKNKIKYRGNGGLDPPLLGICGVTKRGTLVNFNILSAASDESFN